MTTLIFLGFWLALLATFLMAWQGLTLIHDRLADLERAVAKLTALQALHDNGWPQHHTTYKETRT